MVERVTEERLLEILEACYAAIDSGLEPDIPTLCRADVELVARVERLLAREQESLQSAAGSPRVRASSPNPPARLGDFVLLEPLGVGGMSTVYRAHQESLRRDVALKILRAELVDTETGRLRFQREATITASLNHHNIVPVYAAGEIDGCVYLAMRLLHGKSLDRQAAPMAPRSVAAVGVAIAKALQVAHDVGVVHRDIKPANIVIEGDTPVLVDFGLSSFAHSAGTITKPDSTPGTLYYLAPELARRQSSGLDPRVDVYGLGATMYEALGGKPPFEGVTPIQVLHRILNCEPASLSLSGEARDLETIVLRAMAKEPQKRFQTAAELADEIERWLNGMPIRSRRAGPIEHLRRWVVRRPLLAAMSAVALLLAVTLGGVLLRQAVDRRNRWEREMASAAKSVEVGDVDAARKHLEEATALNVDHARRKAMVDSIAIESLTNDLILALHSPVTHQDPRGLHDLVTEIGRRCAAPRPVRTDLALAVATRLIESNPVAFSQVSVATREACPRAAVAISAWSEGKSVVAAVEKLPHARDACDALFTALAMRLCEEPGRLIERELRQVVASGPVADLAQYSLTWALEVAGQASTVEDRAEGMIAAYDLALRLRERSWLSSAAELQCARLAALMGRADRARTHFLAAAATVRPETAALQALSELELLLEIDIDAFPARWQSLQPLLAQFPHYWLQGAYYVLACPDPDASQLVEASRHLENALGLATRESSRQGIELARLQVGAKMLTKMSADPDQKAGGPNGWLELSVKAESYANSVRRTEARRTSPASKTCVSFIGLFPE